MLTFLTSRRTLDTQIQLISGHSSKKSLEVYQHLSLETVNGLPGSSETAAHGVKRIGCRPEPMLTTIRVLHFAPASKATMYKTNQADIPRKTARIPETNQINPCAIKTG
jgi:hypothetical protein